MIYLLSFCYPTFQYSKPPNPFPNAGSAYAVIVLFTTTPSDANVFTKRLQTWILVFYATEVVQSALITGFIAYRIWNTDRAVAPFRASNKSNLMPILRILVESVALQLLVEILVLALYAAQMNAQYILLETICSLVVSCPLLINMYSTSYDSTNDMFVPLFIGNHVYCSYNSRCAPT